MLAWKVQEERAQVEHVKALEKLEAFHTRLDKLEFVWLRESSEEPIDDTHAMEEEYSQTLCGSWHAYALARL